LIAIKLSPQTVKRESAEVASPQPSSQALSQHLIAGGLELLEICLRGIIALYLRNLWLISVCKSVASILLTLALGTLVFGLAQSKETAGTRLIRVIDKVRIKESQWELVTKIPIEKNAMAYWHSGKEDAVVKILEYGSKSEAITAFRWNERMMSNAGIPTAD